MLRQMASLDRAPLRRLALTLLAAVPLAGCGDDGPSGAGGPGDGGAGATTASATGGDGTTTAVDVGAGSGGDGAGGATEDGGSSGGSAQGGGSAGGGLPAGPVVVGGDRPVEVFVPSSYDGAPMPLVILLHGYSASGAIQESYFDVLPIAEELGFLYAYPDGTTDPAGERFWNATDACCDFYASGVDDSTYLRAVVEEIRAELAVDPKRIHVLGHSNGGFMSYRMACDHADLVASVASLAGATYLDATACAPSEPVAALQIHGTADATILYDGGLLVGTPYPGAAATAEAWADDGGCTPTTEWLADRDLEVGIAGAETTTLSWSDGCDPGGGAELWTIQGGAHVPALAPDFARQVVTWLLDHPKP
jgi:polyhydroxybutyrate depolymerase